MEDLERKIIQKVVDNMKRSTKTAWTTGYLDDWSGWARIMKKCINDSAGLLETLIEKEETEEPEKPEK